jgi:Glycosyl transferase family group 2
MIMGFASSWLNQRALFPELIKESPENQTGIIVVVPAFDEPSITPLLDSLNSCAEPDCKTEVLIIVNAPENASKENLENNKKCIKNIEIWKKNNGSFFRLYLFDAGQSPIKSWGIGLARKTGMDEAVRRFNVIDRPDGVIVCLDADCTVEQNYFTSICNELLKKKDHYACSIYFEHPLSGNEFQERIYRYIVQYELHLRYFIQGLKYSGFPNSFHTVGSALAVKALQYIKSGGMNRRQAGEDFYFVQKLIPLGGYFYLNTTTVYPSPRESHRVPFGTGMMIVRLMGDSGEKLMTYNTGAFRELKELFSIAPKLYTSGKRKITNFYLDLPEGLRSYFDKGEWSDKIGEIINNTSSDESFLKRFFGWFNTFMIIKYMNHAHEGIFKKSAVTDSAYDLLGMAGFEYSSADPMKLLHFYRSLEKPSTAEY